jgi:hypothetical protein
MVLRLLRVLDWLRFAGFACFDMNYLLACTYK